MVSKGGKEHAINTGRTSGARPRRAPSTTNLTRYHPIPCTHPTYSYLWLSPRIFLTFSRTHPDSPRLTVCKLHSASPPPPPPSYLCPISAAVINVLDSRSNPSPFQKHPKAWYRKVHRVVSNGLAQARTAASDALLGKYFAKFRHEALKFCQILQDFYMITLYKILCNLYLVLKCRIGNVGQTDGSDPWSTGLFLKSSWEISRALFDKE